MAKLFFYYSAMNAGKTTTLLQSEYNYGERGMETLLFTSALDYRSGLGAIKSRIGLQKAAYPFDSDTNLLEFVTQKVKEIRKLSCVLIDEAQFLNKKQVDQICLIVDQMNIPVLCYGLRTDFQGQLFPGSQALLAKADKLSEIKTICECGRKATMNARMDANGVAVLSGEQVNVGGNETYKALCRKCFTSFRQQAAHLHQMSIPENEI